MLTLAGRTAVVIGAGLPGVIELLEGGMNVAIFTHTPSLTNSIVEKLDQKTVDEHVLICMDAMVDDDAKLIPALEAVNDRFGSIDVIFCFTGGPGKVCELEDVTMEEINKEVPYLTGTCLNFLKGALPYLKKSKAPRVIFITTTEAQTGGTNGGLLDAIARGAVISTTYAMARRMAPYGITVNCISVGPFDKNMPHWKDEPYQIPDPYAIVGQVPLGRVGNQQDVAAALHYLASEEASFITGQVINLNGGLFMG